MTHTLVAFLIATLSGLGIGSGGLLVIYLTLVEGADQLIAQGINLLFFLFSSGASLVLHFKKRHLFGSVILIMSLAGLVGSAAGSLLATSLPSHILRRLFGGMLTLSGLAVLYKSRKKAEKSKSNILK